MHSRKPLLIWLSALLPSLSVVVALATLSARSGANPAWPVSPSKLVPPPPLSDRGADEYVFRPNTDRYVMLGHKEGNSIGKLDAAGNFRPDPRWVNLRGGLSAVPPTDLLNPVSLAGQRLYEYR